MGLKRPSAALLRYASAWVVGGAVAASTLVLVLDGDDGPVLEPLQQIDAGAAAATAGCRTRSIRLPDRDPAPPVAAGIYEDPVPRARVVATLRHGLVVITYRPALAEPDRDRLSALQRVVPRGTVLAPAPAVTDGAVRVRASRMELRCPRADDRAVDAIRLFRGRYIGRRP